MKDKDLRFVVKILAQRIMYLHDDLEKIKHPHMEGCKCNLCTGWRSDPFVMGIGKSGYGVSWHDTDLNKLLNGKD